MRPKKVPDTFMISKGMHVQMRRKGNDSNRGIFAQNLLAKFYVVCIGDVDIDDYDVRLQLTGELQNIGIVPVKHFHIRLAFEEHAQTLAHDSLGID